MGTEIPDLEASNHMIIELIRKDAPFSIVRLGLGYETILCVDFLKNKRIDTAYYDRNINGIYSKKYDEDALISFAKHYITAVMRSDLLASFLPGPYVDCRVAAMQDHFHAAHRLPRVFSRALEPFYQIQHGIVPWTHHLKGKKVLIINPFVDSFQKQLKNGFKIFKDPSIDVFLEDQEFVFYKSYQTIAHNHLHDDWCQTYKMMCADISDIQFDIALLACGAYGLPLCDFIKTKLGKSAIYVGGGLQLCFGVMGKRWEANDNWKKIIEENNTRFIRPNENERIKNMNMVDYACYW